VPSRGTRLQCDRHCSKCHYAVEQTVKRFVVSDCIVLCAADIEAGGLKDRLFVSIESEALLLDLRWLSEYRPHKSRTMDHREPLTLLRPEHEASKACRSVSAELFHRKYSFALRRRCKDKDGDRKRRNIPAVTLFR